MRSESSIQGSVVKWARVRGAIAIKLTTAGRYGTSGWPDYEFLYDGRVAFIEFKRPGAVPTEKQLAHINALTLYKFPVYVCSDVKAGQEFLRQNLRLPA